MRIAILSGAFPPKLDGIGDYTWNLANELVKDHQVLVVTSKGVVATPRNGVEVVGSFDPQKPGTIGALGDIVQSWMADWILVQYNPFSFGPRGYCLGLPMMLRRLRRRNPGAKVAVMFHETYVPANRWKFLVMRIWQIPQFAMLCRQADRIFVSTVRWVSQVKAFCGNKHVELLPVGSNIPRSRLSTGEARARLSVAADTMVIGAFGSDHPSRLVDWIGYAVKKLSQAHPRLIVIYVGKDGGRFREACDRVPFRDLGILSAVEAGNAIRGMGVMLCPFVDGLSSRRGSALAALQNGVPIISTCRSWTDNILRTNVGGYISLSSVSDGMEAYGQTALEFIKNNPTVGGDNSNRLQYWFDGFFSWPRIAATVTRSFTLSADT